METISRKKNASRNLIFSAAAYIINLLLAFGGRTIFLHYLSVEYLGLNSLFSNILTVLSLAELGFGSALVFAMYKPYAENDIQKVRQLLLLYKKLYRLIAIIILVIGLCLLPFLRYLIKEEPAIEVNIHVVYVFFLFNNIISYFLAYRRSLLFVSQRNDIESKANILRYFLNAGLQILAIALTQNFYLYLVANTVALITDNVLIYFITSKLYSPYIVNPESELPKEDLEPIKKNVYALIFHKIGSVFIFGIDSILITYFISLKVLGVYSNYLLIVTQLNSLLTLFVNSIKASIGNYIAVMPLNKTLNLFNTMVFVWFWIIGFCAVCLLSLFQPFITIWLGADYLLSDVVVVFIVLSFVTNNSRCMAGLFKECAGIFYQDRFKPLLEAIIKLAFSLLLARSYGIIGILSGTIISNMLAPFWIEPIVLFKHYFKMSAVKYFAKVFVYMLVIAGVAGLTWLVVSLLPLANFIGFIVKAFICALLPNLLFALLSFRTPEFKNMLEIVKNTIKKA